MKCMILGCRNLETRCIDCNRVVNTYEFENKKWISVKDQPAPKTGKFLFSYHCGIGLAAWGQAYTVIKGNSERTHKVYFLVLWPMDISENQGEPMQWDEKK